MQKYLYSLIFLCLVLSASANENQSAIYWIQLKDKNHSPYSIHKPEEFLGERAIQRRINKGIEIDSTDLPVNPSYIDSLKNLGFRVKHKSRWMNGLIAYFPQDFPIDQITLPSFVDFIELRKPVKLKSANTKFDKFENQTNAQYENYLTQVTMMNGHQIHDYSKGKGAHVAVIDAGFLNANTHKTFEALFSRNGVLGTYDFVNPGNNVYKEHSHGTMVLSTMAAFTPGTLIGTAPEASYWLLRSEDVKTEYPIEEDYWIIAIEFADSVGCDVINTSLGYYYFDDPSMNHSYEVYNGKTLRISRAANLAVDKGMVMVCSAGNEGRNPWKYIIAPSEAEKVLSVAAVDSKEAIASFSSYGFGSDHYPPKPDVAAMGHSVAVANSNGTYSFSSGTSFSSPLLAGLAACLVALKPKMPANEIIQLIRTNSDRYPQHDSLYGYGIPDFGRIYQGIIQVSSTSALPQKFKIYPNPFIDLLHIEVPEEEGTLTLFSFDGRMVFSKELNNTSKVSIIPQTLLNLPKGVYFAVLKQQAQIRTIKLIKQ